MKIDPALCEHANVGRTAKIETISVPELGIEQLCLRVRVFCKDCREAFTPKTMSLGFSTEEIGVVGDELFVPLEEPHADEESDTDEAPATSERPWEEHPSKEHLH